MRVLITGAKGMLGQALAQVFAEGNELFLWDRDETDITQKQVVSSKLSVLKPDLVINAAAYNNVDGAETDTAVAEAVNGYAVGYLAKVCKQLQVPLVHYSTDYVFAGTKIDGYVETDEPQPISRYGASKYLGEQELQKHTDQYYLIRLSKLFGREAASAASKKSFVDMMLNLARTKTELDMVDEELSCPTYALDLAKLTKDLVEGEKPFGIYHGTNSGAVTWYGFAQEIFKISGIDVKLNPVSAAKFPRPAKRPRYGILLNTKLPSARPWQEALKEFLSAAAD